MNNKTLSTITRQTSEEMFRNYQLALSQGKKEFSTGKDGYSIDISYLYDSNEENSPKSIDFDSINDDGMPN